MDILTLDQLRERLPREGHPHLEGYLRWLRHSLNNPLGTTMLELYSARRTATELKTAIAGQDSPAIDACFAAFDEIFANLEQACVQARAIVAGARVHEEQP